MAAVCIHTNKEMYEEACFIDKSSGFLVGLETASKRDIFIVGLYSSQGPSDKVLINKETLWLPKIVPQVVDDNCIAKHYPAGCGVVGIWLKCEKMPDHSCLESVIANTYKDNKDILVVGIVTTTKAATSSCIVTYYHRNDGKLVIMSNDDIKKMTHSKLTLSLRLKVVFDLVLPSMDSNEIDSSLMEQFDGFRYSVNESVLWIPEKQIVMATNEENITLSNALGHCNKGPIAVEMLQGPSNGVWPIKIELTPVTSAQSVVLQLDVLGIFHTGIGLRTAEERMKEKLLNQLDTIMSCVRPAENQASVVGVHHFLVPTQAVPITVVYPELSLIDSNSSDHEEGIVADQSLIKDRERLHQLFCLPHFQPYFRKMNLHWPFDEYKYLINPHCELTVPDNSTKCQVAMVTGYYAYRHYMQDRFNDNGWGCAYRSLQTIWSWFQFQGYTEEDVPTHNEIQATLVDCGDKETSFIGTKEWIGSFEVSTVLNHKLQIDSRIHQCPTGADMSGMGPVLLKHFQTQGTPVMIGGGVLAHTIIGVSYNRDSGDIKFLILDPHYTGSDELKLVLGKGCGWKSNSFWDQTASYNMCMPIRPKEI